MTEKEMTFDELAEAYFNLKKKTEEQEAIIGQYQTKMTEFEQSVRERDDRIAHLQTIIVDHVGTSEKPKAAVAEVKKPFEERYKDMIRTNITKE